jgi:hypothetical protein
MRSLKPLAGHPGLFTPVLETPYGQKSPTEIDREMARLAFSDDPADREKFAQLESIRRENLVRLPPVRRPRFLA